MVKAYSYIRISSLEQLKGYSKERQLDASLAYAKRHQLELDEELTFQDLGVSGFTGKNVQEGELGAFLKCVQEGTVKRGSYLLVESFDRLGRTKMSDQIPVFLQIINAGITVVTLKNEKAYSKASIDKDLTDLMTSLVEMSRANEESETKSMRVRDAWQRKRCQEKILTAKGPAWLSFDRKKGSFVKLPERCRLIERIFRMSRDGIGKDSIAKKFNEEKVVAWGKGNGWHGSYVQKILNNRSVIGDFQPHQLIQGNRTPVGEVKQNYFPQVISDALFFAAQKGIKTRAKFAGRTGTGVSNLFTGIAKCGYSGSPMVFINKGTGAGKYLVSDWARRGKAGQYVTWSYKDFETSFLTFISELDFAQLIDADNRAETTVLESQIDAKREELSKNEAKIQKLVNAITVSNSSPLPILDKIKELEAKNKALLDARDSLQKSLVAKTEIIDSFRDYGEGLKNLIAKGNSTEMRYKLRNEIRNKVEKIEVFPAGFQLTRSFMEMIDSPPSEPFKGNLKEAEDDSNHPIDKAFRKYLRKWASGRLKRRVWNEAALKERLGKQPIRKEERYFKVYFKNGVVKTVTPSFTDPTKLDRMSIEGAADITARCNRWYAEIPEMSPEDFEINN